MLIDGQLAVHVNAGDRASTRKVTLQAANGTFSDGQEHSVILIRSKRYYLVNYCVPLSARSVPPGAAFASSLGGPIRAVSFCC